MFDLFRLLKRDGRRARHAAKPRRNALGLLGHRRPGLEVLESRDLLSIGGLLPALPGMHLVDPNPASLRGQTVYVDFKGAKGVDYNGPVTIPNLDVPAFKAGAPLAGQEHAIVGEVLGDLATAFAGSGVAFTANRPTSGTAFSTVYVGGDDSRFAQYGSFLGLAEDVDVGNRNHSDNAFVFSDELAGATSVETYAQSLAAIIEHETGHLLGYEHNNEEAGAGLLSDVAYLAAPTLNSPANGATGVSTTPLFSWSQVSGNAGYRIIVSTNLNDLPTDPSQPGGTPSNGLNVTVGQNTTSYAWGGTLTAGATYYWEVHALGSTQYGTWSNRNSFATQPAVTRLAAPTLSSPASGATAVSTQPTFSWSQVSGNQGYRIIVSTNSGDLTTDPTQTGGTPSNGFNVTVGQNTTSYAWTGTLTAGATYYWEVHALGTTLAQAGYWSTENSFATQPAVTRLAAPTLSSPASGATAVSTQPTFSWSQVSGNQGYRIIVSTNSGDLTTDPTQTGGTPSNGFNVTVGQNTTSYAWTGTLTAGATYYWEVHALGTTLAQAGYWSTENSFATQPAVTRLAAPTLSSPASGATAVSTQPTFSWSQVSGNQGYRIIVSTNSGDLTTDPTQNRRHAQQRLQRHGRPEHDQLRLDRHAHRRGDLLLGGPCPGHHLGAGRLLVN